MGFDEIVVVVEGVGVEDFEELVPFRVGFAECLDGIRGGEVLEGEVGWVG